MIGGDLQAKLSELLQQVKTVYNEACNEVCGFSSISTFPLTVFALPACTHVFNAVYVAFCLTKILD